MSQYDVKATNTPKSNHSYCHHADTELPFFPKYDSMLICQDKLLVTWFEMDFSQGRYNVTDNNSNGSNACTLIAIILAHFCTAENIELICPNHRISNCLIKALGIAIIKGNTIYNYLKQQGQLPNVNLSIPEAIECAGKMAATCKEWKSMLYMQDLDATLFINFQAHLDEWCSSSHSRKYNYLFTVLICDSRSVLLIFNKGEKSIALVDSHQHSACKGAAIAITHIDNCRCLCSWFAHTLVKYYHSNPDLYELSFLYFRGI